MWTSRDRLVDESYRDATLKGFGRCLCPLPSICLLNYSIYYRNKTRICLHVYKTWFASVSVPPSVCDLLGICFYMQLLNMHCFFFLSFFSSFDPSAIRQLFFRLTPVLIQMWENSFLLKETIGDSELAITVTNHQRSLRFKAISYTFPHTVRVNRKEVISFVKKMC